MAEVRQIPSAVGAFEAQVIDFNKTYRAIVDNASAIRRRQAQAQKDIEKQMDVALADKRAIRPQDSDYVEEKRQEVYNYYFQNRDNIMAGGKAAGELKMKMGEFTSAVNQSSSLNKRGMSLNPAWKEAMKDENQMDDGLTEVQRVWSLPINDPKRKDAKFDRGGYQASIDEFDVPDISYYKKFNEIKDIYEPVTKNVKPYPISSMELTSNKRLGLAVDENITIQASNPIEIANTVTAAVSGGKARGFLSDYSKQLSIYKSLSQEDRELELKGVIDAYKDLPRGTDMTSWFAKEGGSGIDNELELAVFKQLQNALPQIVKEGYDYRTQKAIMEKWRYGLAASQFDWEKTQTQTLDQQIFNDLKSGNWDNKKWNGIFNALYNTGNPATGGVRPANVDMSTMDDKGNVTITYYTQKPILKNDGSGNFVTSDAEAEKYRNPTTGVNITKSPIGVWYSTQTRTEVINKKDPAAFAKFKALNSRLRSSVNVEEVGQIIDTWNKGKEQPTIQGKTVNPTTKGSDQSIREDKTMNR